MEVPVDDFIVNNTEVIPEIQYDINEILDYSTIFLWNHYHNKYVINKIMYRHNSIYIWMYSTDYSYSYKDLKALGDYIKSTMSECKVIIIYNHPNKLLYSVKHYIT